MMISVISWLVLGVIAGSIAGKLVYWRDRGLFIDIVLGIVGALLGGWLFKAIAVGGVTGFNLWSILLAIIGSVIVLGLFHAIKGEPLRV